MQGVAAVRAGQAHCPQALSDPCPRGFAPQVIPHRTPCTAPEALRHRTRTRPAAPSTRLLRSGQAFQDGQYQHRAPGFEPAPRQAGSSPHARPAQADFALVLRPKESTTPPRDLLTDAISIICCPQLPHHASEDQRWCEIPSTRATQVTYVTGENSPNTSDRRVRAGQRVEPPKGIELLTCSLREGRSPSNLASTSHDSRGLHPIRPPEPHHSARFRTMFDSMRVIHGAANCFSLGAPP